MIKRKVCRDCDVQITDEEKYCAAHAWFLGKWLKKSNLLLDQIIVEEVKKRAGERKAA